MQGKLILLTSTFPFSTGETFLETELPYLAQHFSKVVILPLKKTSTQNCRLIPENCSVNTSIISKKNKESNLKRVISKIITTLISPFFYEELFKVYSKLIDRDVVDNLLTYSRDAALSKKAVKQILNDDRLNPREVLIYSYWLNGATLGAKLADSKYPVVSRVHRGDLYEELYPKNYIPLREKTLSKIDVLFSISEDGIRYLSGKYHSTKSKLKLSRLGIHIPDNFHVAKEEDIEALTLASCSSINKNKRVDKVAQSLIQFAIEHPSLNLDWNHFGSGPGLSDLETIVQGFPKNLSATLHGHIDNTTLLEWYRKNPVHLFINLSKSEGIPVSIMEANSYGIPAIATNVGGTSELVNKESGWLLNKDFTATEIQETLQEALLQHSKRSKKAYRARKMCITLFDSEKNYPVFTKKLHRIMHNHERSQNR